MTSEQKDLLESLVEGVVILYGDRIIFANKTIKEMLGYDIDEDLNPLVDLFPSSYYLKTLKKTINSQDSIKYLELEILKKNGDVISINISISTYYDSESLEPLYKVVIIRDITTLDQARENGIIQFKLYAMKQVSTALIHFESHSRGPVLSYFEPLLFDHNSENDKDFLTKTALFYLTAVGGGSSYSCGAFGPLPIYETDNYLSIVYTTFLKNPDSLDKRSKGRDYFMYIVIFPKFLEKLFSERKILKSTFSTIFDKIEYSANFEKEVFDSIKEKIVFRERSSSLNEKRFLERKLAAITELSTEVSTIFDLDTAFENFTAFAEKVLDFKLFTLFLHKENQQILSIVSYRGYSDELLTGWQTSIDAVNSIVAKCARTKKVINIGDVNEIDYYYAAMDTIRSELAVPIIFDDYVLGVINIESAEINAFNNQDERIMIALSSIIANFLSKRNYERTLRETFELNRVLSETKSLDEVYNNILVFVKRVLKLPIFSISILSRKTNTINLVGNIGFKSSKKNTSLSLSGRKGIIQKVAKTGKEIILQDTSKEPKKLSSNSDMKSECAVAIKSNKKVIGVLTAKKYLVNGFSKDDIALLHALSKVTSNYLVQKRLEGLTNTLFSFAEKLLDINSIVEVFSETVESIKSTQDYEYLSISIVDHEQETVNLVAYYGFTANLEHIRSLDLMSTKSIVVRVARERRAIIINNITKESSFIPMTNKRIKIKSEIAVPFLSDQGNILGIINVESKYVDSFNQDDQIILVKFGKIIARAFRKFSSNDIRLIKFE